MAEETGPPEDALAAQESARMLPFRKPSALTAGQGCTAEEDGCPGQRLELDVVGWNPCLVPSSHVVWRDGQACSG